MLKKKQNRKMGDNKDQRVENWKEQENIKGNEEYSVCKRRNTYEAKELIIS